MLLFMDMEKHMVEDWIYGLNTLKDLVENLAIRIFSLLNYFTFLSRRKLNKEAINLAEKSTRTG